MAKRQIRQKLRSLSLRTFTQFGAETFANDIIREMDGKKIDYCILDEWQIGEWVNPMWLRPRHQPHELNILNVLKKKGVKLWGMSRGYYVFYRGDKPGIGKEWRKQTFSGIRRIRPFFISRGDPSGVTTFGTETVSPYRPRWKTVKEHTKKLLFVGGIHGVGKTTLTKSIAEGSNGKIGRVGEAVNVHEFIFDHRYEIRDTAEAMWYSRYIDMIISAIHTESPDCFIVDRTIFDFVPYSDELSADFIRKDGTHFLQFLAERGHEVYQVFLTAQPEILRQRIRSRRRKNHTEEMDTLIMRINRFRDLTDSMMTVPIVHDTVDGTLEALKELFPKFFKV